jgi:hypothetical protein
MFVATVVLETQIFSKNSWHTAMSAEKIWEEPGQNIFAEFFEIFGKYF